MILLFASVGDKCVKCDIKDGVAIVKFDTPDSKVTSFLTISLVTIVFIQPTIVVLQSSWRNWVLGCEVANSVVQLSKQF